MQETEYRLSDMLFCALRKWRSVIIFAVICAVLAGTITAISSVMAINDPEQIEMWQTEYETLYGAYWAPIKDLDRKIAANERLSAQVQFELERLARRKTEYEARLEDLNAQFEVYENRIKAYEESIAGLEYEKERLEYYLSYRKEHNENNLLMKIDPYNVNTYEVLLRVDSGYEILPGNVYQNIDPTPELLQTYNLLVNNTGFFEQMIASLNLNTEVRYITDVISIGTYGTNSIRVRVISDSSDWAKKVCEYISDAILESQNKVQLSIAEHKLYRYNTNSYTVVDNGVYSSQHSYNQQVLDYEASIRSVDTSILNTDASIRSINADIRLLHEQIGEINIALRNLPLEEQDLQSAIDGYKDANLVFKSEQFELLKQPEPEYEGYTVFGIFTGFIKMAIFGGILGVILACIYFVVMGLMSGKVLSSEHVCETVGSEFFGYWPKTERKKQFAFIDDWIEVKSGCAAKGMTAKIASELVLSNIAVACAEVNKIMLCGGAHKRIIAELADAVKLQIPEVEVITGGSIDIDPVAVRGLAECDAVILVEQLDVSNLNVAVKLKERAQAMEKPVLGVVVRS